MSKVTNVVEMKNITKIFGDFKANDQVNFTLRKGEVHALLGENGAGKSTLMNVLYGLYGATSGEVYIRGKEINLSSPKDAIDEGVGMVHQHFMLIPQLSVTQNIFLGMQKETGALLDLNKLDKEVEELAKSYDFNVRAKDLIWQLSVGLQQKVEILKILMRKAEILILDEPTAVLTPSEVIELFTSIKKMTVKGYSVILITHKMEEVLQHCDRVTVMRLGKAIGTVNTKDTSKDELAEMMVGREVSLVRNVAEVEKGEVLFKAENLVVNNDKGLRAVDNLSFSIRGGEIFGIAGVDGNGQLELAEALVGMRKVVSGNVFMMDKECTKATPRDLNELGLAQIPDDRHKKGLVLPFTVKENIILGSQRQKNILGKL